MSSTKRGERGGGDTDFFETPEWVTHLIVPHIVPPAGKILDPCGGRGAILRCLFPPGPRHDLYSFEIDPAHRDALSESIGGRPIVIRDALSPDPWNHPDGDPPSLIVMNPPFKSAAAFVARALDEVAPCGTVVALLRAAFLESEERHAFNVRAKADLYFLPNRPSFTTDRGTDSSMYAWFVWSRERGGRWFLLPTTPKDIRCPRKPRAPK
jgi:hypothetical protein